MTLSFSTLRKANILRLPQFKNSRGAPAHSMPDGSDWSLGEWMNAVLGELGEAANLIKKIKRGDMSMDAAREELGKEFADIVTYIDITSFRCGVDLQVPLSEEFAPFEHYAYDFSALKIATIAVVDMNKKSLGENMSMIVFFLGKVANEINKISFGGKADLQKIQNFFGCAVGFICLNAMLAGIDLEAAVRNKFNAVSKRVSANVFIDGDRVVDDEGTSL